MKMTCKQMIDRIKMLLPTKDMEESERFFASLVDRSISVETLPDFLSGITKIQTNAFSGCTELALTSLPAGITTIDMSAFSGCTNLAITVLPEKLERVGWKSFSECTSLTTLTFKSKPSGLQQGTFEGCTNLTTINVPWSEGEVDGAPWGATNATINYNYKGE